MDIYQLIISRRSIRRFKDTHIPRQVLEKCINAARLAPTAGNLQPLEYIIIDDDKLLPMVFSTLQWAAYIRPEGDPPPGKRPTAYIVILKDKNTGMPASVYDVGTVLENIILVALGEGIGSCAFATVDREKLKPTLNIPDDYEIPLVLALGYPDESPVEEPLAGSVKYWRDERDVHHVPKKQIESILHLNNFQKNST